MRVRARFRPRGGPRTGTPEAPRSGVQWCGPGAGCPAPQGSTARTRPARRGCGTPRPRACAQGGAWQGEGRGGERVAQVEGAPVHLEAAAAGVQHLAPVGQAGGLQHAQQRDRHHVAWRLVDPLAREQLDDAAVAEGAVHEEGAGLRGGGVDELKDRAQPRRVDHLDVQQQPRRRVARIVPDPKLARRQRGWTEARRVFCRAKEGGSRAAEEGGCSQAEHPAEQHKADAVHAGGGADCADARCWRKGVTSAP